MSIQRLARQIVFSLLFFSYGIQAVEGYQEEDCYWKPTLWEGFNIELKGSYLYWGVQEDQLGFAIEGLKLFQLTPTSSTGKLKTHQPKWDSGFRIETGFSNDCMPISCRLGWTYFQTHSIAHSETRQPGDFFSAVTTATTTSFGIGFPYLVSKSATSKWNITLNEYAFDLDYAFSCAPCISFHSYLGVLGVQIDQKQQIAYNSIPNGQDLIDLEVTRKNNFWGVGPRLGLGVNWQLLDWLAVVGNASSAFVFGKFDVKNSFFAPPELADHLSHVHAKSWRGRPMVSGSLGFEWKDCLTDSIGFSLGVLYEFQYWWQQWHSSSNVQDCLLSGEGRWGDLSLQGLVISAAVTF